MERLSGMVTLRVGGASVVAIDGLVWGVFAGAEPGHWMVIPAQGGIQLQDAVTGNLLAVPSLEPFTQLTAESNDPYAPHSRWVATPIIGQGPVPFGVAGKGEIFTLQLVEVNRYIGIDLAEDNAQPKELILFPPGMQAPLFLVEPLP